MNAGAVLSLTRSVELVLNTVVLYLLSSVFSLKDLGDFYLAFAHLLLLQIISALGVNAGVSKEFASGAWSERELISSVYSMRVVTIVSVVFIWMLFSDTSEQVSFLIITLAISELFKTLAFMNFIHEYKYRFMTVAFIRITSVTLAFLLRLGVVLYTPSIELFCMTYVIEAIIIALLQVMYLSRHNLLPAFRLIKIKIIRSLIFKYRISFISGFVQILVLRSDIYMIAHYLDQESVGLYGFSLRVVEIPISFAAVFAGIFYARALNIPKNNLPELNALSRRYMKNIIFGFGFLLLLIFVGHPPLFDFLFDGKFSDSYMSLSVLLLASLLLSIRHLVSKHILLVEAFQVSIFINASALLINILLNALLIPRLGISGAAIGTVCALAVSLVGSLGIPRYGRLVGASCFGLRSST